MNKELDELIENMSKFTIHADEKSRAKAVNELLLDVFFLNVRVDSQSELVNKYLMNLTAIDFETLKLEYEKILYKNLTEASAKFLGKYGNL